MWAYVNRYNDGRSISTIVVTGDAGGGRRQISNRVGLEVFISGAHSGACGLGAAPRPAAHPGVAAKPVRVREQQAARARSLARRHKPANKSPA